MKEFLGIGGYTRSPAGAYSWQHLAFVGGLTLVMILLAVILGLRNRKKPDEVKNRVLIIAALLMDGIELFKLIVFCARGNGIAEMRTNLPLFLCSIQLIAMPVAAFARGRVREAALDFVFIFGLLGSLTGTFGAAQNYNAYPVLGIENVASGLTHSLAGFASLYVGISGMAKLKTRNIPATCGILIFFVAAAFTANALLDYNYMFLRRGDGTPYDILMDLAGGNEALYAAGVVLLFFLWIGIYYLVAGLIKRRKKA